MDQWEQTIKELKQSEGKTEKARKIFVYRENSLFDKLVDKVRECGRLEVYSLKLPKGCQDLTESQIKSLKSALDIAEGTNSRVIRDDTLLDLTTAKSQALAEQLKSQCKHITQYIGLGTMTDHGSTYTSADTEASLEEIARVCKARGITQINFDGYKWSDHGCLYRDAQGQEQRLAPFEKSEAQNKECRQFVVGILEKAGIKVLQKGSRFGIPKDKLADTALLYDRHHDDEDMVRAALHFKKHEGAVFEEVETGRFITPQRESAIMDAAEAIAWEYMPER